MVCYTPIKMAKIKKEQHHQTLVRMQRNELTHMLLMGMWNGTTTLENNLQFSKRPWSWEGLGQEEKGTTEDEMAGWHHWLDGRESGWTPGVGDGQGGLACCNSGGHKESDMTERLNWTEKNKYSITYHTSQQLSSWPFILEKWRFLFTGKPVHRHL